MVSASHNPADDNGLKVLDGDGLKLDDAIEDELERLIWRTEELGGVGNAEMGRMVDDRALLDDYRRHRLGLAASIAGRAACGSCSTARTGRAARSGRRSWPRPAPEVDVIHAEPDGININVALRGDGAGARWPRPWSPRGADVGFALDGDADRLIAVDAAGQIVDGDQVLGILALDRLARGALPGGALVVSVLSNGGLQRAVEAAGGAGRPDAGRRQVHPRGHAGRRGPASAARRAATSSCSSTPRRATGS